MRVIVVALLLLATVASASFAQDTISVARDTIAVAQGARLRALAYLNGCYHPDRTVGLFQQLTDSAVILRIAGPVEFTSIPLNTIRELSVSDGGLHPDAGAKRGALIGAAVGGVAGFFLFPKKAEFGESRGSVSRALIGLAAGGLVGYRVGAKMPMEKWRPVALPARAKFSPPCPEVNTQIVR